MMVVYWCDVLNEELVPQVREFPDCDSQLTELLQFCADLRSQGKLMVTSTSHLSTGADIIRDGKLPNGQPYTWKKRRL